MRSGPGALPIIYEPFAVPDQAVCTPTLPGGSRLGGSSCLPSPRSNLPPRASSSSSSLASIAVRGAPPAAPGDEPLPRCGRALPAAPRAAWRMCLLVRRPRPSHHHHHHRPLDTHTQPGGRPNPQQRKGPFWGAFWGPKGPLGDPPGGERSPPGAAASRRSSARRLLFSPNPVPPLPCGRVRVLRTIGVQLTAMLQRLGRARRRAARASTGTWSYESVTPDDEGAGAAGTRA
eukprot:scaffold1770_cov375-Prasinococcus_capsulatus_cf.AAC.21